MPTAEETFSALCRAAAKRDGPAAPITIRYRDGNGRILLAPDCYLCYIWPPELAIPEKWFEPPYHESYEGQTGVCRPAPPSLRALGASSSGRAAVPSASRLPRIPRQARTPRRARLPRAARPPRAPRPPRRPRRPRPPRRYEPRAPRGRKEPPRQKACFIERNAAGVAYASVSQKNWSPQTIADFAAVHPTWGVTAVGNDEPCPWENAGPCSALLRPFVRALQNAVSWKRPEYLAPAERAARARAAPAPELAPVSVPVPAPEPVPVAPPPTCYELLFAGRYEEARASCPPGGRFAVSFNEPGSFTTRNNLDFEGVLQALREIAANPAWTLVRVAPWP